MRAPSASSNSSCRERGRILLATPAINSVGARLSIRASPQINPSTTAISPPATLSESLSWVATCAPSAPPIFKSCRFHRAPAVASARISNAPPPISRAIVTIPAPVHTRCASHATNIIVVYDSYPTSPPRVAAIAAPTGPPRLGLRPRSTLTRLTVPNAANASSASEKSSRAIRPPGDGAVATSSTASGGVSSIGAFSFSLRAMGFKPPSRTE